MFKVTVTPVKVFRRPAWEIIVTGGSGSRSMMYVPPHGTTKKARARAIDERVEMLKEDLMSAENEYHRRKGDG